MTTQIPVVLCFSGHDPTGGAGIQADIEILRRVGCHPVCLITALTAQDTCDVKRVYPQDPENLLCQARVLLKDIRIAAIKIGLLGSPEIAGAVLQILDETPGVPIILDPIISAGGGHTLAGDSLLDIMLTQIIPRTLVLTPNTCEARALTDAHDLDICAELLLNSGCQHVLITGTHEESDTVVNRWYAQNDVAVETAWPRLPYSYHGSGCTLASAIAGSLAKGFNMSEAIVQAQKFTWDSLKGGYALGRGQLIPQRLSRSYVGKRLD